MLLSQRKPVWQAFLPAQRHTLRSAGPPGQRRINIIWNACAPSSHLSNSSDSSHGSWCCRWCCCRLCCRIASRGVLAAALLGRGGTLKGVTPAKGPNLLSKDSTGDFAMVNPVKARHMNGAAAAVQSAQHRQCRYRPSCAPPPRTKQALAGLACVGEALAAALSAASVIASPEDVSDTSCSDSAASACKQGSSSSKGWHVTQRFF